MVVVVTKVRVCNVCMDPDKPTERYNLSSGSRRASVDLCEDHAQPFEALLDQAPKRTSGRRMTAAEIAAAKRTHKRTAKKVP